MTFDSTFDSLLSRFTKHPNHMTFQYFTQSAKIKFISGALNIKEKQIFLDVILKRLHKMTNLNNNNNIFHACEVLQELESQRLNSLLFSVNSKDPKNEVIESTTTSFKLNDIEDSITGNKKEGDEIYSKQLLNDLLSLIYQFLSEDIDPYIHIILNNEVSKMYLNLFIKYQDKDCDFRYIIFTLELLIEKKLIDRFLLFEIPINDFFNYNLTRKEKNFNLGLVVVNYIFTDNFHIVKCFTCSKKLKDVFMKTKCCSESSIFGRIGKMGEIKNLKLKEFIDRQVRQTGIRNKTIKVQPQAETGESAEKLLLQIKDLKRENEMLNLVVEKFKSLSMKSPTKRDSDVVERRSSNLLPQIPKVIGILPQLPQKAEVLLAAPEKVNILSPISKNVEELPPPLPITRKEVVLPGILSKGLPPLPEKKLPPLPEKKLPPLPGKGLPPLPGKGLPPLPGKGLPPLPGKGLPSLPGKGLPPLSGKGLPPLPGKGLPPLPGKGLPPLKGQGLPTINSALKMPVQAPTTPQIKYIDIPITKSKEKISGLLFMTLPSLTSPITPQDLIPLQKKNKIFIGAGQNKDDNKETEKTVMNPKKILALEICLRSGEPLTNEEVKNRIISRCKFLEENRIKVILDCWPSKPESLDLYDFVSKTDLKVPTQSEVLKDTNKYNAEVTSNINNENMDKNNNEKRKTLSRCEELYLLFMLDDTSQKYSLENLTIFQKKLSLMYFLIRFETLYPVILSSIKIINTNCEILRNSKSLVEFLSILLSIYNSTVPTNRQIQTLEYKNILCLFNEQYLDIIHIINKRMSLNELIDELKDLNAAGVLNSVNSIWGELLMMYSELNENITEVVGIKNQMDVLRSKVKDVEEWLGTEMDKSVLNVFIELRIKVEFYLDSLLNDN
ncbi:hypothetical protein CDIK_1490 [Cucumispora dikerogammari]|nr:hypothetical protein CDIK_1490 [Cucumispora dikerogammari]